MGGQGPKLRSTDHLGRSSEAKDRKKQKKVKCDGPTDGRTNGPTKRGVESRSTRLIKVIRTKEPHSSKVALILSPQTKAKTIIMSIPIHQLTFDPCYQVEVMLIKLMLGYQASFPSLVHV